MDVQKQCHKQITDTVERKASIAETELRTPESNICEDNA